MLLPEALEKWPVQWFKEILPRQLEIICELSRSFLDDIRLRHPGNAGRVGRVSLIDDRISAECVLGHVGLALGGGPLDSGIEMC
jgi:starch phosphorylase